MRFSKPAWVTHQDQVDQKRVTLYSCHVHPDGSRLATGGLDAKIRIWSTLPILNIEADVANVPKKLCTLSMHTGPVLCVRWSYSGKWLASGSDDAVVMIWDLDPNGAGRVWGNDDANVEGWKALKRLPGHTSDVTDLAWAPNDRFLASVGLDNTVIIWCGHTLEALRKLDQHQGFVKGVCWDPVGEYLATQSDDKSVMVWRTTDWGLEATVTKPFQHSPGSTFFRRLSWSPDGAHITASNAMNNNGYVFVAAVISRNEWASDICLVGHENTVEVAAYNPHIFLRDPSGAVQSTNICSVVALGADDLSISIWQTKSPRPLIVARDAFDSPVYDLSWSTDGLTLYACSADGSLGVFDFDAAELDGIVNMDEKEKYLKRFGFVPPSWHGNPTLAPRPIHNPNAPPNGIPVAPLPAVQAAAAAALDPGPAFDKKGRRRIKPVFVSAVSTSTGFGASAAPAPFNPGAVHVPQAPSHFAPTQQYSQNVQAYPQPMNAQPYGGSVAPLPVFAPSRTHTGGWDAQTQSPHSAYDPHRASLHDTPRGTHNGVFAPPYDVDGDADMSHVSISGYDTSHQNHNGKRKASAMTEDEEISYSGNGGRPPRARTLGGDVQRPTPGPVRDLRSAIQGIGFVVDPVAGARLKLDVPPLKNLLSVKSEEKEGDVFEAMNYDDGKPSEVTFSSAKQTQFLDYPSAPALSLTMTSAFCAAALEDCSVNVYSHTGRRLLPALVLDSPCAFFEGCRSYLMAITASGMLHVWNIESQKAAFAPISIAPLLSPNTSLSSVYLRPNGAPVLLQSSGTAHTYDPVLCSFTRITESRWSLGSDAWEGRQRANRGVPGRGPIASLEGAVSDLSLDPAVAAAERPQWWEAALTLGHLESRQHAAKALDSPIEYKTALQLYAKRIADEGFRAKAEELVKELFGPMYWKPAKEETWCPSVLGMNKRELLKEVLSIFARSKTLAKLGQDWQDTLRRSATD